MRQNVTFKDYAIVACGTMIPELNYLKANGFLDAKIILYTTPGLHQVPSELEKQLLKQLSAAKEHTKKIIIVYGGTYCYINMKDPYRTIDTVIDEMKADGFYISRTMVHNCIDMVASAEERDQIANGNFFRPDKKYSHRCNGRSGQTQTLEMLSMPGYLSSSISR